MVLAYETLSETHWNVPTAEPSFVPDFFINIDRQLKNKLAALKLYKSQINEKSPSRSVDAAEALAKFRGSQNGFEYAECSTCTEKLGLDMYKKTKGFFTEYSKSTASEVMAEVYSHLIDLEPEKINQIRKLDKILNKKISYIENKIKKIDNSFIF